MQHQFSETHSIKNSNSDSEQQQDKKILPSLLNKTSFASKKKYHYQRQQLSIPVKQKNQEALNNRKLTRSRITVSQTLAPVMVNKVQNYHFRQFPSRFKLYRKDIRDNYCKKVRRSIKLNNQRLIPLFQRRVD